MIRRVTFDGADEHEQKLSTILMTGFFSRGSPRQDQRNSKDDFRSDARIKLALERITAPREDPDPKLPEWLNREFKREVVTLSLEQPEFSRLQKYIDETQWSAVVTDLYVEVADRLDAAEKIDAKATA